MNTALTISSSAPATEVGAVHGLTRMAQATRARVLALFATPLLVFISAALVASGVGEAKHYLNLVFTPLEVVAVFLSVITVVVLGRNGETNWFEGVLLLGVYAILAVAFFYLPAQPAGAAPGH